MKHFVLIASLLIVGCGNEPDTRLSCECISSLGKYTNLPTHQVIQKTVYDCPTKPSAIVVNESEKKFLKNGRHIYCDWCNDGFPMNLVEPVFSSTSIFVVTKEEITEKHSRKTTSQSWTLDRTTLVFTEEMKQQTFAIGSGEDRIESIYQCKIVEGI